MFTYHYSRVLFTRLLWDQQALHKRITGRRGAANHCGPYRVIGDGEGLRVSAIDYAVRGRENRSCVWGPWRHGLGSGVKTRRASS